MLPPQGLFIPVSSTSDTLSRVVLPACCSLSSRFLTTTIHEVAPPLTLHPEMSPGLPFVYLFGSSFHVFFFFFPFSSRRAGTSCRSFATVLCSISIKPLRACTGENTTPQRHNPAQLPFGLWILLPWWQCYLRCLWAFCHPSPNHHCLLREHRMHLY